MNYIGISSGFHDAALTVIDNKGDILYAGHSERYSKKKHDNKLCSDLITDALTYLNSEPTQVHYYERPWMKSLRKIRSGQSVSWENFNAKHQIGIEFLNQIGTLKVNTHNHHLSHAAAGFQTSPYQKATVVVIDAIGEFDTISIWGASYDNNDYAKYKLLWKQTYPDSIGLFYTAMTKRIGLRPLDEEYILMGMSGWGKPIHFDELYNYVINNKHDMTFKRNFHVGVEDNLLEDASDENIASTTQLIAEILIYDIMDRAASYGYSENLVYMGGVALNCLANRKLGQYFDNVWIMPNPGDAGSSLGAAALGYGKKLNWTNAYLGHNMGNDYPVETVLNGLLNDKIVGVATGRAEFGPRALGHRSLLADPRGSDIKDRVNDIKRRQKFRPFAPIILEEYADKYFDMPKNWVDSRYMQIVAPAIYPDLYPAVVHVDGTSRIQTVPNDGSGVRKLIEMWHAKTGCPLLLNTSLNIRGEPMVNDRNDADRFEKLYNVKVYS